MAKTASARSDWRRAGNAVRMWIGPALYALFGDLAKAGVEA